MLWDTPHVVMLLAVKGGSISGSQAFSVDL